MQHKFDILICAIEKGVQETIKKSTRAIRNGFSKSKLAVNAFNASVGNGNKLMAGLSNQFKAVIGAYVGFEVITRATQIMKEADQAAFNMASSVGAAAREFDNVGSIKSWENAISRLSKELVIYSDTALKNAISRTVDMTKRLGLNQEQMEEVIKRSADLGAGKLELTESIERITAALRGEAESAEYLGLTLNEDYIKSWYKANVQTERAWKDLTDLEKAQIRYAVMLEQSAEFAGRAAKSSETFGGALAMVRKEAQNAVINNANAVAAMNELAQTLRDNAQDIGELIGKLVTFTAWLVEFTVKYKKMIAALATTAIAFVAVRKLTTVIRGLNAAFTVLSGKSLFGFTKHVGLAKAGTNLFKGAVGALTTSLITAVGALASFYAGWKLGELINDLKVFKDLSATVGDAVQYTYGNIDKLFTRIRIKNLEIRKQTPAMMRDLRGLSKPQGEELEQIEQQIQAEKKRLEAIELGQQKLLDKAAGKSSKSSPGSDIKAQAKEAAAAIGKETKTILDELEERINAGAGANIGKALTNRTQSEIKRLKALNRTALTELQSIHDRGEIKMTQYFDRRRNLIQTAHEKQMELLQQKAAQEQDPAKKQTVLDQIFEKEQAHKRTLIQLVDEQLKAEQKLAEEKQRLHEQQQRQAQKAWDEQIQTDHLMAGLTSRATRKDPGIGIESQFTMELAELDARHAAELEKLEALNAAKSQIDEAYRLQKQEKDRLLFDQEQRINQQRLENTRTIASGMSDIFKNLYALTGKKSKEFFYLSKAAALAEAIVNTAQGVTKALAQGGYLGPAMAAVVSAMGAVQIATIAAQKLATGGKVLGASPSSTADNIPIMATAGEFMQPVSAVKYYGGQVMEALRKKIIPREIFSGISLPSPRVNYTGTFATGGQVPQPNLQPQEKAPEVNITNIIDPNLFDRYLASTTGQKSILNVLSQNSFQLKQVLQG